MSTTNSAAAAWLTQEAFDRLKAELDHLSGPGRAEIVQKIDAARQEGDLKENGGYHAAKEEQGKIAGDEETFLLGSREIAGDSDLDVFSEKSPLGSAILGHKEGETLSYTAPNGKDITVEILSAKPYAA